MVYSDGETYSDAEIFSEPEDLFNDEAEEDGKDKKSAEKEDEEKKPEEETKVKKKPKRIVKNPRKTLNFDILNGRNGLSALKKLFKDFKFKGDGHEMEDLTRVMAIFQQWVSYYLYPGYDFESCLQQLETLGRKKVVQTLLKKYRAGIDDWGETKLDDDGGGVGDGEVKEMEDFDVKLDEEITKVRSDVESNEDEAGGSGIQQNPQPEEVTLTQEQLERIARNRKLAEERRMKRMSEQCSQPSGQTDLSENVTTEDNSQI